MRNISPVTIIFGLSALVLGWLSLLAGPLAMIQFRQIALVLLVLFFYSLSAGEIEELREKIRSIEEGD